MRLLRQREPLDAHEGSSVKGSGDRPKVAPGLGTRGALVLIAAGVLCWALGQGIVALWLFMVAAVVVALVLPLPAALVSPLFMGVAGWLVDMLPMVVLVGWAAVSARWGVSLLRQRRMPRGGRFVWLAVGLAAWTGFGALAVVSADLKHFALLFVVQLLISATLLTAVDSLQDQESRRRVAHGLLTFVVLLSTAVFLQWVGVPVQELKDPSVADRVESAYGVDVFTNSLEMIKYVRSSKAGAPDLRGALKGVSSDNPSLPPFEVFKPKFQAWRKSLMVSFQGSARPFEEELSNEGVDLLYDSVGLAPANNVPRMRSFPRNSLTYAGVCAALFPLGLYAAWTAVNRKRWFGWLAITACLFGAAFSLARGSWLALLIGVAYLAIDGSISLRRKLQAAAVLGAAAVLISGLFLAKYGVDPLSARGEAEGSVNTREVLYADTVERVSRGNIYFLTGYGTETARGEGGTSHRLGRYIPSAGTHSTYLNYVYRTGVVGALLLITIYAGAWLHARAAARTSDGTERVFSTCIAAAIVSVAAHGMILSLYVEPVYTLVVSLLLGVALATGMNARGPLLPWRSGRRR
ncbi:MAG: O-antigen ligase family protein [Actinomycetota bacterium]